MVNKINRPSVALLQNIKYLSALVINKNIFFFSIHIFFFQKKKNKQQSFALHMYKNCMKLRKRMHTYMETRIYKYKYTHMHTNIHYILQIFIYF